MRDARRLETRGDTLGIDPAIALAIAEAVSAGIFWRAANTNAKTAAIWNQMGADHHRRAGTLLAVAMTRLGAYGSGSVSR